LWVASFEADFFEALLEGLDGFLVGDKKFGGWLRSVVSLEVFLRVLGGSGLGVGVGCGEGEMLALWLFRLVLLLEPPRLLLEFRLVLIFFKWLSWLSESSLLWELEFWSWFIFPRFMKFILSKSSLGSFRSKISLDRS
jgi:hypothetical protein